MKNILFSLATIVLYLVPSLGQQIVLPTSLSCATDEMMATKPNLLLIQQALDEAVLAKIKQAGEQKAQALPYVLPVVVHIIHNNGPENIPDTQVFAAIEHLNQAFAHEGYYADQGTGANTQIQFCLARRSPDGQLTSGITRTVSPLTELVKETEDQALKDLIRWDPTQYVNVWVVSAISSQSSGAGVAGYAYLASAHGQPYDGLVCEAAFFGTDPAQDAVFIHEIGHYLNLYHTFQGGCPNGNCQTDGDRVCDTPPDQATHTNCVYNSCTTDTDDATANNPFGNDVNDPTENFMDYSPFQCYRNFTDGQGERMRSAIEQFRYSLLESEGCIDPCSSPITASFLPSATNVLAGETVVFANQTTNALNYGWYVNGNLVATTADLSYQFTGTGNFEVELRAYNADPNCLATSKVVVSVACGVLAGFTVNTTELEVGEALVCTNTSIGATSYQWTINGVGVGTNPDLSYTFSNAGNYTLYLQAIGPFCNDLASQSIVVLSDTPCPDSVTGFYYALSNNPPNTYLTIEDRLPNGDFFMNAYYPWNSNMIIKMDGANEVALWQKRIEVPVNGLRIRATEDGGAIGNYIWNTPSENRICKLDSEGNIKWVRKILGAQSVWVEAYKNGAVIFNDDLSPNQLRMTILDENGNTTVNRAYDNSNHIDIHGYYEADNGAGFYLVGSGWYNTSLSAIVLKFDTLGNLLFSRGYNEGAIPGQSFEFSDIKPTADGGFIAVGRKVVSSPLDNDFLLMKADANGDVSWAKMISMDGQSPVLENGISIFIKADGGYVGRYSQVFPSKNYWFSFEEDGTLEFVRGADWDSPFNYFSMLQQDDRFYITARDSASSSSAYITELDLVTGPKMGCIGIVDFPAIATNFTTLQVNALNFATTQNPMDISPATYTELPSEHTIEKVTTCTAPTYACPEVCDNALDDDKDGYVDCFDSDCQCFDGVDCSYAGSSTTPIKARIDWQTPTDWVNASSVPMVVNLDPQNGNIPEIIVPEGDAGSAGFGVLVNKLLIYQGDGSNASNPDVLNIPEKTSNRFSTYAIADVNSDGIPEMAVSTQFGLTKVYSNFNQGSSQPMTVFATGSPTSWAHGHMAFADFDQDGTPELYNGNFVYQFDLSNPNSPQLNLKLSGASHAGHNNSGSTGAVAVDILSVADCNGDPDCNGLELVAGAIIYAIDLDPLDGDGLQIKVIKNLNNMSSLGPFQDGYNYVADLNLDGLPEIVTAGHHGPANKNGFYVWDKTGLVAKFENPDPGLGDPQFISLAIANVFDDHSAGFALDYPEIIYPTRTKITSFNLQKAIASPTTPYWWSANVIDGSRSAGPSCFDLNSDGFAEIIYRDEQKMHIMYGGALPFPAGVDANRNWMVFDCQSATIDEYPVIADIDGDEEAEILVTGKVAPFISDQLDNRGRLIVIESDGLPWPSSRALWNQYSYFGVNINDDLTVPKVQQTHYLEWPQLGSGHRPWNTFHTQWPIWGNDFNPYSPVPDAIVNVDSTACEGDSIRVWLTLCNQGSTELPDSLPIAFYQNDPRLPGAVLRQIVSTPSTLPIDTCAAFSVKILGVFNVPIFVVANDDGTHPLPYAIADFPVTTAPECDFENNFDSFTLSYQAQALDLGPDRSLCSSSVTGLSAGAGFLSYRWQDGSTDSTYTAYSPGTYWVDAMDACGNLHSDTVIILLNQTTNIDLGNDREICEGESVQLSVSGFSDLQWSPSSGLSCNDCPSPVANPMISTTYYLTAANGNCFASDSIRMVVHKKPLLTLTSQNGDCSTIPFVGATAVGLPPISYQWSNGQTSASINPSNSGTYWVSATDANGCLAVDSASVIIVNNITANITSQPVSCNGSPGTAIADANGGAAPYSYQWSNGGNTANTTVTMPGNIDVTITDANGCITYATALVGITGQLQLGITVSPISCHEGTDGSATVMPIFGTSPFTWEWQSGQTTSTIANLGSGSYSVTVSDAIGCTDDLHFSMTSPPDLLLSADANGTSCFGENDGSATVTASGGTPSYSYFWSNFQTNAMATQLAPGSYTVTVTDENGCSDSISVIVGQPPLLTANAQAEDPVICPDQTTNLMATATGGTAPLSYAWTGGSTDSLLTGVGEGFYTILVTDANGCTADASISVQLQQPATLTQDSIALASSSSATDGAIFLDFVGGSPPFSYLWSNGDTTQDLQAVPPGTYSLTMTDAEGCEQVFTFTIDFLNGVSQGLGTGWLARIYPNPMADGGKAFLHIQSGSKQSIVFQLLDVAGRSIATEQLEVQANGFLKQLPTPSSAGVYWVVLKTEKGIRYLKWVVL